MNLVGMPPRTLETLTRWGHKRQVKSGNRSGRALCPLSH
jgi:hypothetical protein